MDGRTGGRGGKVTDSRADGWTGPMRRGQADGRTGQSGAEEAWSSGLDRLVDGRTGGQRGGPGFKRPHSTRPISLLGAQSACLVRARVCRLLGNAVGSRRILSQTPVLSAQAHLPRLSASVLGAEKDILLLAYKNGFNQGRWQRNTKSKASNPCTKGRGWRWEQEKAQSGGL